MSIQRSRRIAPPGVLDDEPSESTELDLHAVLGEDEDDENRRVHLFKMWKGGGPAKILFSGTATFSRQPTHTPIGLPRVVGIDTESLPLVEGGPPVTLMVTVSFMDVQGTHTNVAIDTPDGRDMLPKLFELLFERPGFAQPAGPPSDTKQRAKKKGHGRHGRRKSITPVLLVFQNLPYDVGRLLADRPHLLRSLGAGADSYRFKVSERWEVEVERLHLGSGAHFSWYVRDLEQKTILHLAGFDLVGYWKQSLAETASGLGIKPKTDIEAKIPDVYERSRDSLSDEMFEWFREYGLDDVETTSDAYRVTARLLAEEIDARIIRRDGILPPSAPGAAARAMFAQAFDEVREVEDTWSDGTVVTDPNGKPVKRTVTVREGLHPGLTEWPRYPAKYDQLGCYAYFGGNSFNVRVGVFSRMRLLDLKSAYPSVFAALPDPVTAEYVEVSPRRGFKVSEWAGRYGVLKVSGESLDPVYPPFRVHSKRDLKLAKKYDDKAAEAEARGDTKLAQQHREKAEEFRSPSRLRYVFGKFEARYVTIPELAIGVARGALRIDQIHGGVWIRGSSEKSFMRAFVERMFRMKEDARARADELEKQAAQVESRGQTAEASALRAEAAGQKSLSGLAKLMLNSPYGKLIEAIRSVYLFGGDIPIPQFWKKDEVCESIAIVTAEMGPDSSRIPYWGDDPEQEKVAIEWYERQLANFQLSDDAAATAYVGELQAKKQKRGKKWSRKRAATFSGTLEDRGEHAVRAYLMALQKAGVATTGKEPTTVAKYLQNVRPYRAGHHFLPLYGSQITGETSAKVATMGACLGALQGDTDSVHVPMPDGIEDPRELPGFARYQEIIQRAGYPAPLEGLGAWELEGPATSDESILARTKVYSHRFDTRKKNAKAIEAVRRDRSLTDDERKWRIELLSWSYKQASHSFVRFDTPEAEAVRKDYTIKCRECSSPCTHARDERQRRVKRLREQAFHETVRAYLEADQSYMPRKSPRKIRPAIASGKPVGEFISTESGEPVTVQRKENPHTEWIDVGGGVLVRHWKPMPWDGEHGESDRKVKQAGSRAK